MTSRPTSRSLASASRRRDEAAKRLRGRLAAGESDLSSHQRADGAAADGPPFVRAEWIAIEQVVPRDDVSVLEIHDPQIGVGSRCDIALVFQVKPLSEVSGRNRGHEAQIDLLGEQQLAGGLAA